MQSTLRATHLCKDLLNVDEQVLCVMISDVKGGILAIDWKKGKVPWEGNGVESMKLFEDIESKLGMWTQIILGLASQTAPLIGSFERASFVHKNFQLVLLGSIGQDSSIGLMLNRSASVEHVISKVREMTGPF
jgi:hypothetical protein